MRRAVTIFLVYLFLFPLLGGPVLAEDLPSGSDPRTLTETPEQTALREAGIAVTAPAKQIEPQVNQYMCTSSELPPNEVQNILDLLKNGFTGKEIAGQTSKDTSRDTLDANELVLTKPDDENTAVKVQVPSQKFKPWEISQFLNSYVDGPFSLGVVLEDSLRAGRCETMSSPQCALTGPNLKYRNSGAGIVANLKPLKEFFEDKNKTSFTAAENKILSDASITGDINSGEIKTAQRLEKELLHNSILTNFFEAKLETNCNNSSCVISTYSLFDKYFNSWMSTEMVVSTFGPSLLYHTKKLFGWTGRRGFLTGVRDEYQAFLDRFRSEFITPESVLGRNKLKKIANTLDKYGWRGWWEETVGGNANGSGYYLFKTEEFQHHLGKMLEPDGFLSHIKTQEQKSEFLKMLYDMRSVLRAGNARVYSAKDAYIQAAKHSGGAGLKDPVVRDKYIEYGREMIRMMDDVYDDGLGADYIEWVARYPSAGFYDKGLRAASPDGYGEVINMFQDHRNLQRVLKKLKDDGSFGGFESDYVKYGSAYESNGQNIVMYNFDPESQKTIAGLSYSNVKAAAGNKSDVFIQDQYGNYVPYNNVSYEFIQNRLSSNANIVEGKWKKWGELSPEDVIARIDNARTGSSANLKFGAINIQQTIDALQERNWVSRRYWNALDKLVAQEDELIRDYFTIKGGAKWTTLPFAYWWAKKGFGIEGISQYQLPQTWHRLKFTIGPQNIYDYSYIDFFANEGSDQGDIFIQMINKLPWKIILDELSDKYNPIKNLYNTLTQNELRNETENLAFYLTGPEDCSNCGLVLRTEDLTRFNPFFFVQNKKLTSYILEDTVTEKARQKGQTLILYSSHTNLVGQSGSESGEPIDLVKAINDPDIKTCSEAVADLEFYGLNIGKVLPKDAKVGAVLSGLESITYGTFFWAGIFSTAAIQIVIAPQLHGCVDVDEGYYAHYFVPVKEEKDEKSNTSAKSTEKVSNLVQKFKDNFIEGFKGDQNNFTKQAAEQLGGEIDKFVNDSKDNDIVQATLRLEGTSSGQLDSRTLFYFWCGRGCDITPASYKQTGSEEVRGTNGVNVGIDFAKGEITANGVPIVQSKDNVRLSSTNLGIPAIEIPHTLTETCLENTPDLAFEINAQGEVRVMNPELLKCIQEGVIGQTGLELSTNKLNDAFGELKAIVTTTHPNIKPTGEGIIAEGLPRKVAEGVGAKVKIYANKDVNLSSSNDGVTEVGSLESLQFENGVIVVKPNGCFVTWLKHHEDGILSKDLVEGIKPKLTRELNSATQCEDPAINFELIPDLGSDFKVSKVDKFNDALAHQGPFTIFETATKRYAISAEKNAEGICEDHLRVIDKDTGAVTDYVGKIAQTPEGFKITTNDGKQHEVKFSTKDGAPFIQLDENKPELLNAAQGKNGSFYYDPDKGLWFAENAQLLPLIEAFREGIAAKVQPNGETTATASGNVLNLDLGKDKDSELLNLPSLPQSRILILLIMGLLIATFIAVQRRRKIVI